MTKNKGSTCVFLESHIVDDFPSPRRLISPQLLRQRHDTRFGSWRVRHAFTNFRSKVDDSRSMPPQKKKAKNAAFIFCTTTLTRSPRIVNVYTCPQRDWRAFHQRTLAVEHTKMDK